MAAVEIIRTYHYNGDLDEEYTLLNGVKEGVYKRFDRFNGQIIIETTYIAGKKEGLYQAWHENGQKCVETNYTNGELNGLYKEWYYNGNKASECNYINGKRDGLYKEWGKFYNTYNEFNYMNGSIEGFAYYYSDDKLIRTTYFKNNIERDFKLYVKHCCNKYKEELIAKVFHPDRLERIATYYVMDVIDYMDCLCPI